MPLVNIPGVGRVNFPDTMTNEQISAAIRDNIMPRYSGGTQIAPTMPLEPGRPTSQPSTAEQAGRSWLQRNIFDPGERGFQNLMIGAATTRALSPDSILGLGAEEAAEAIARRQRRLAEIPRTEASQRAFREAEETESIPGAVGRLASSSAALGDIALESAGTNPIAAPVGALANVTPVPVLRQVIGALAGALGFPTEYLTSVSNGVMEAAQRRGVDVNDPAQLTALLRDINANPELRGEIRSDALVRAGIISAADAAAGYGAGRVVTRGVLGRVGGGAAIEAAGGGLGEAGAQLATEGRIAPADIAAEIIGGAGMGALGNIRQSPTPGQDPALQAAIEQIVRARGGAQPALGTVPLPGAEPPTEPTVAEAPIVPVAPAAPAVEPQPDLLTQPTQPARPEVVPPEAAAPEVAPTEAAPAEPRVTGFTTAQGSTYQVNEQGQTIRTKRSPGRGQGKTYAAHNAVYVEPQEAERLLEDMRGGLRYRFVEETPQGMRFVPEGQAINPAQTKLAVVDPDGRVQRFIPSQGAPAVGLSPVELRYERQKDGNLFANRHIGNPIVGLEREGVVTPPAAKPDWRMGEPVEAAPEVPDVLPQNVREIVDYMRNGRRTEPKGQVSLVQAIIKAGGLKDTGGDLKQIMGGTVKTRPGLINKKGGLQLDRMSEFLTGRGYFVDFPTDNELLNAISEELAGRSVNYGKTEDVRGRQLAEAARDLDREMNIAGVSAQNTDAEIVRALGIETPSQPRTLEDIEREDAARSAFSARSTEAVAETPAVSEKKKRTEEKARRVINKFLKELRSKGRQSRIFAGDLERLLKDRTMTAEQIYRGFMVGDMLSNTIPSKADYRLRFLQDLVVDNEKAGRASGAEVGQRAQGRVVYPDQGSAGIIELSLAKDMLPFLNETTAHEGFHVLQTYFAEYDKSFADRVGKFFKEDMKISDLEPSIKRRLQALKPPGSKVSYYDSLVQGLGEKPLSVKEAQAYAFGALVDAANRGKPTTGILPPFQRFVLFVKDFMAKLKSALNKDGFESAADLLTQAQRRGARMTQAAPIQEGVDYSGRRVTDKDPVLQEAAQGVRAGTVTREEYEALVNERKPVAPYAYVPEPATEAQIVSALERTEPRKAPLVGKASEQLKEGDEVGLRLDIPAYSKQNTWVVSVHQPKGQGFYAGTPIGYEPTAIATDVNLGVVEKAAMKIAAGDIDKTTIAVMRGKWKPATPEEAKARADAAMKDPNWIQVGMDPRRHQYFYDRTSMEPVVAADEVIQVGPLVLAKNPTYARKDAYQYSARRVPDQYAARATGQVAGLPAFGQRTPPTTPSATQQAELNVQYDVVSKALGKRFGRFIPPAKIESFFMKFQDKMLPVGRMIDEIRAAGGKITVAMDAYLKEDLLQGKVASMLEKRKRDLYDPLVKAVADSGLSMQDFENFLYARHAPERNEYMARINPDKFPDGGSGLTNQQAKDMMAEFQQQGKTAKLTELAKMFDAIIADTNRLRVEAGLTPDFGVVKTAEDGRPLPNWEFYAPLRNFVQESVDGEETVKEFRPKTGKALGARGREDRRATGRERLAGDILAHAMMQNTQSVIRSENNKVGQSFLAMIRANPDQSAKFAEVIASAPLRTTIVNGIVKTMPDPLYKNDPDVLVVKENGKEVAIRIFDDNVARAMTGASALSPASKILLVQGMAAVNRFLAKVNTAYNPEFLITNFARDLQTFGINVQQFDIDGLTKDVMGDLKGSLSGIRDVTRGTNNNPEMARYFERFRELGGTTDMYGFADIETRIAEINEIMNTVGTQAKSWKDMAKVTAPVIKFLEDYNTVVENGVRTSLFKNLVERGFNEEQAAQAAKNITVNFSKGGENRVFMNAMYLFYNASLQGSMAMMNAIGRSPKVRKIVAGVVVAGVLQDVLNSMLSDVDDDEDKVYDKIPDHVLKRSFVLMDPFKITDRGYFSFPMPYGFNAFFNMGREMSKAARGATDPMKAAGSIVGTFVDSFNPIGGSESILNFVAPTILDPVVDIVENRDFAGRPIVPERGGFGPQPPESQKYWGNTFAPYVQISEFLNEITGGTRVIPGAVDISPSIIQYAVNYATGGVGKFVERSYNTVTGTIPDALRGDLSEVDVKGIPLLRSLYGNVTARSDTERYMGRMEEVLRVRKEIQDASRYGQVERVEAAMQRYPGQVQISETFNRISRDRAQISQRINEINRNPNIDAESKREIIKTLRDQQNALVVLANQLYNENVERRR